VRWAAAGLLLERLLRASVAADRVEVFSLDVLTTAANDLEKAVRGLFRGVLTGAIPAHTYRAM
jgi:hypothetical protein